MDDVVLNKSASIERCVRRVREEYAGDDLNLTENITKQDAIILNIQRACEAAIDLAMHLVRKERLGIPQDTREAFDLIVESGKVPEEIAAPLKKMVGFRNIAIHEYQKINLAVVRAIIQKHLDDLLAFAKHAVQNFG